MHVAEEIHVGETGVAGRRSVLAQEMLKIEIFFKFYFIAFL